MPYSIRIFRNAFLFLSVFHFSNTYASHSAGGEIYYKYKGDSVVGGTVCQKYEVTLVLYQDILMGQPEAVAQDNPAFIGIYKGGNSAPFQIDTAFYYNKDEALPVNVGSSCGYTASVSLILRKKTFIKTYLLPPDANGYVIAYQRCCRNATIMNITSPGDNGATFYCNIPPKPLVNLSAVFNNDPPLVFCLNMPIHYYQAATDADGDSLSYEFCSPLNGASEADIKPIPVPPPYDSVVYQNPYSFQYPLTASPAIHIDPQSGLITGTPNVIGRYLICVCCHEWRNGALINTVQREFQIIITDCSGGTYHPSAGNDTAILAGQTVRFHGSGTLSYLWTPAGQLSNDTISDPYAYFPIPGTYTFVLHGKNDSCTGTDTVNVWVLAHSQFILPNAFTPNGDMLNDVFKPLPVMDAVIVRFRIYNRFGNLVYDEGPGGAGWDGTYKGVKQDMGVYFWQLNYIDNNGVQELMKGNVTLIR